MKASLAVQIIQQAMKAPVPTWLDYTPKGTPLVVYDEEDFIFINHPNPPSERPDKKLTASTVIEINGILTATILSSPYLDERTLVPVAYHECFHGYQGNTFQPGGEFNFFEVLAFYPELDAAYRALCSAETEVLNNTHLSPLEQARRLSALAEKRQAILSRHSDLLDFEKTLERNEGTASYVEQKACAQIYGLPPDNSACYYSYFRQYFMGPAICWLLEKLSPAGEWQAAIEKGASLTETLRQVAPHQPASLDDLDLPGKEQQEALAAAIARASAVEKIGGLLRGGAIRLKLPERGQVFRSFSPRSIISLGDGRLLHPEFVVIQLPHGQISIRSELALEDYLDRLVVFRAVPYELVNGKLSVRTETIQITLENVTRLPDGTLEIV